MCLRAAIEHEVKEVRLSSRLTSSPACLVADEHDLTPRMQKLLEQLGQAPPPVRPVLELNPNHPLMAKLKAAFAADSTDPRLAAYARLLLGQAYLADTGQVPDAAAFGKALDEVMLRAL
jgi:molecular chaperone HtpG